MAKMRKSYVGYTWEDWYTKFRPTEFRIDNPVIVTKDPKQLVGNKVKVRITIEQIK